MSISVAIYFPLKLLRLFEFTNYKEMYTTTRATMWRMVVVKSKPAFLVWN